MENNEELLLLKIENEFYNTLQLDIKQFLFENYIQTVSVILQRYLEIGKVHFIILKNMFSQYEQNLFNYSLDEITFLDGEQNANVLTKHAGENLGFFVTSESNFPPYSKRLLIKNKSGEILGAVDCSPKVNFTFSNRFWESLSHAIYQYFQKLVQLMVIQNEKLRYQKLQTVANRIHSTMDINKVLHEVIYSLEEIYPSFEYKLLLSNDSDDISDLPVGTLDYTKHETAAWNAFVTGEIRTEDVLAQKRSLIYFPLKGNQGVYGVLQISTQDSMVIPKEDVEFISALIQAGSHAIENAKLFQQSKKIVEDLRLVTAVSQQLNDNLRLLEIVDYIAKKLKDSFQAHEVGFVLLNEDKLSVLPGSTSYFAEEEANELLQYIKEYFEKEQYSLFIGNFQDLLKKESLPTSLGKELISTTQRNSRKKLKKRQFLSIMVEPLKQDNQMMGFAIVLHEKPYYFSFETFKLFQTLTHHSSLAFTNSLLREELEQLVITDYLTKLYSRNFLDDYIDKSMENDSYGTFLLMDIDNFKVVNDTYGHHVGDEVLVQIANIIKSQLKGSQIGARWGGEEIAIYLSEKSLQEGMSLARQLLYTIEKNTTPKVTVSCGVAYWDKENRESPLGLFKKADNALYKTKNEGKNKAIASGEPLKY